VNLKKDKTRASARSLPFDLRAFDVFLAVAEARGFTAAAKRLRLTQSAVSQIVSQLEKGFGMELLDRKVKPLALTVAGRVLHREASSLLEEARRIVPMVRGAHGSKLPLIRVGVIDSLFRPLAPILGVELRAFADQLSIMSGLTQAHRAGLLSRDLDIAIMGDALEEIDGLERFLLVEESFILLLPSGRRDRKNGDLALLAADLPLVRYSGRSQMGRQIELYLRRLRLKIPLGQEYDSTEGVIRMVAAGMGWAIITPLCVLDASSLVDRAFCAPLPLPRMHRQLSLVARNEMGGIPQQIATLIRQVLKVRCIPEVRRMMPWLNNGFRVE
jgi:DNA-binding transcriptional LysR family regulator